MAVWTNQVLAFLQISGYLVPIVGPLLIAAIPALGVVEFVRMEPTKEAG